MMQRAPLRVGIGGFGAIGLAVARALDAGMDGLELEAVSARDQNRARARMEGFKKPARVIPIEAIADACDIVIECLPASLFGQIARPAVARGRIFMPLSVGALLDHWDLVNEARKTGARIMPPTGALLGLDAVRAAAEGRIAEVRMVTRKPPRGLAGAPYLAEHGIDVERITEPTLIFSGTAREGAKGFPANVNVAAALSLAGTGPDATKLEIWADPGVSRNMHTIHVEADSARFTLAIENVPSEENPRTGKITALSTIAALRALTSTLKVGS